MSDETPSTQPQQPAEAAQQPAEAAPQPAEAAPQPTPAPAAPTPAQVPTPAVVPTPAQVAAAAAAAAQAAADMAARAARWGRVGEDGTVFVRTAEGERAVGSYPGATAEEALAYFARKYDELLAQVDLLDQRVRTTDLAAKEAAASVKRLRATVVEAAAVGDLDGLVVRLDALGPIIEARRAEADAAREAARAAAVATKEAIVAEAESLAESDRWKASGDRLRELFDAWKAAPRIDRKRDDELWTRFRTARSTFDKRRRTHFAHLDSERADVATRKDKIVTEAEALAGSTDWGATSGRFRTLMDEWKAAGRAGREDEERLWSRFRAAQDAFFSARNAVWAERDSGQRANLAAKEALLAEAEALVPVTDLRAAKTALRSIQERWEKAGHVPRGDVERVEARLRRVEQALRGAEEAEWRRTNPEARARAEATVAQLRESIASLEKRAATARDAGDERALREAEEGLTARRSWLAEAERTLAEFTR